MESGNLIIAGICMLYIVEINKPTEKIEECWALLSEHRDELATNKTLMVLKPDILKYKTFEDKGLLFALALYDGDNIVGYSVNVVMQLLHYSDTTFVQNDVLFIKKEYRRGSWGLKLIHETERLAKRRGGKLMMWHGKKDTVFNNLMPRLGYGVQDILFSKEL